MFVNTVPVRFNFTENTSFENFVKNVSQNFIGILRHQKYSYNTILEDIRAKFNNIPNLYNIIFSYQLTKAYDKTIGNYKTTWNFNNSSANDIAIHIYDINDTGDMEINYDYLVSKYSEIDISNLHKRIIHIISQIVENPDISLNDIDIVTPEEKHKILYEFNNTSVEYPRDKTIIDLFEEQVEKTPDNIAVVFEDQKLTYKELNEKANSLAHYLKNIGLEENNIVSLFFNKSIESIIAILATLKCSCAYMPIDTDYPNERINYMINHSNSKYILTLQCLEKKLCNYSNVISINLDNSIIYKKVAPIHSKSNYDSLAYVMYTSGSTGNPKGVMVSHQNVIRLVKNTNYIHFMPHERFLQTGSIVFDACTFEIWGALLNGYELYIIKKHELIDPILLEKYLIKNKITISWITAPLFNQLIEQNPNIFRTLRVLLTGGDVLSVKHINRVKDSCPNLTIINGYGPTENTTFSTCFTIEKKYSSSIPIGYPISNSTCYVVSKNMKLQPIGVPGELLVGGDGVSKGYFNLADKTNSSFIPNVFSKGTLYKTGDFVKWNPDGSLNFIGRIDNQVKIRGFRVEINEINLIIQQYPNIKESCIIIKEINNEKVLCCYFSSTNNIDINSLKNYLKEKLPLYSIPTYYIQMDSLPINANGKIDRNKLPLPQYQLVKTQITAPRNNIDAKLIELLHRLLNINDVSIDDNFFEIGGDSLSAITFCTYIQKEFGIQLYVKDIIDNSQIRKISDIISRNNSTNTQIEIKSVPKSSFYQLSSAQKRIYFASQMDGNDSILYNIPGGIIFENEFDIKKLEKCINIIIQRQESLRTYFEIENENVVQKIENNINFKLDVLDNENFDNIDLIFNNFVKPFDLSKAPLFRAQYLKFTNGKNAIFIDMHHIICDGTSLSIFIDELVKLYNNITLPDLNIQYKDYATYEYKKIKSDCFKEDKLYWLSQFQDDPPVLNLPTQFPRLSNHSFIGKKIYSLIDKQTTKKIQTICKNLEITPYMFLLACYYILLSKYTSQDDIVIGSPIVGRDIAETYNIIGMFVNTLALRNKIDQSDSFKAFVLNVKNNLLNTFNHQTYPFDELVKDLNISRDTSRNPLFDTMFIYQNKGYHEITIKDITATYYIPDTNISKFDLSVEAVPQHDTIHLTFEYATSLFTENFVKNMSIHYLNTINSVLDNLDIQIKNIDILSSEEKHTILYDFNNTSTDYPKDKTIIDLFEEQVDKTPDDIAVVFEDQKLTYKELNEKANSLANYLRFEKNINRNDFVGIMVNRSLEMIISILAVLKSGAAYIPIDPTYPKDRVDYMLKNSNSKILLTQNKLLDKINFENKISIDLKYSNIYSRSNINLVKTNTLDDLMYIIYTSGSTGTPKGVMISHKVFSNFTNYCNNYVKYLKNPCNQAIVSITTVSFDIFAYETLISLQKGLKVVIANENEQNSPILLNKLMETNNVQIIQSTPSVMNTFINLINEMPMLKNLKYVILAGEQLPLNLVKELHKISNIVVYNGYGPSETYYCTLTEMNDEIITIGKPIYNSQMYILDKNLRPVPVGIIGDIYISGDCVGKGYLNKKDLTEKSFIPNPFLKDVIMYRSGDVGKYLDDGNIICLGRSDYQVKLRGLRIELEEIENVIQEYPNINKCVVIKNTINNKEFLVCYFTAIKKIETNNLKQYISNYLPRYMIPSYFIVLENFPYTPNGKVDKKNLPDPQKFINITNNNYIAPTTYLQIQLVNIFEKILNISPIGITDNFFELGGDSLLAMTLNMEILKISNKINYQDIFNCPTILELENKIISMDNKLMFKKIENLSEKHLEVLKNAKKKCKITNYEANGILLTGATGYLGIHILYEFIKNSDTKIYCIVRDSQKIPAKTRLKQKLQYYFNNTFENLFDSRIFVISGDIAKINFGFTDKILQDLSNSIDVVINSAAIVSHFGSYDKIYNANVKSVENIISFCKKNNKKLYHISTIGVSGLDLDSTYLLQNKKYDFRNKNIKIDFDESSLYIGQNLENIYIKTKFEAENMLLQEISNGLDAYIIRMGHLMPRYKDGIFQENTLDNELINKMLSFIKLGFIPNYLLKLKFDLTPVDDASNAVYKLIEHPSKYNRVFHIFNPEMVSIQKLVKLFSKNDFKFDITDETNFVNRIKKLLNSKNTNQYLKNILYDFDNNFHLNYESDIKLSAKFSIKYLKKTGFKWHKNTINYLYKILEIIRSVL